jgi:ferredoxin
MLKNYGAKNNQILCVFYCEFGAGNITNHLGYCVSSCPQEFAKLDVLDIKIKKVMSSIVSVFDEETEKILYRRVNNKPAHTFFLIYFFYLLQSCSFLYKFHIYYFQVISCKANTGIVHGKFSNQGVTQNKITRNLRVIAEGRVGHALGDLCILNSYWVNQDSTYKYFEVSFVDPIYNVIRNDVCINWICNPIHKHREIRGVTSSDRYPRGLNGKGHSCYKICPSKRAVWRHNQIKNFR